MKIGGYDGEADLLFQISAVGLPTPIRQAKIIPDRRFRWDFTWPDRKLAVEIQGSTWVPNTGHTSGTGLARDYEKNNEAVLQGYRCLYFTSDMVKSGVAVSILERALA